MVKNVYLTEITAAVAQSVRMFALQAEGWMFESQPRHTLVVKTGSDTSTAKRSPTKQVWHAKELSLLNGYEC